MKRFLFSLLLALVVGAIPLVARAQQGVPFSITRTCVNSSGGFDLNYNPLLPIPPGGFFNHSTGSTRGFTVNNSDGTQTQTFRDVTINLDSLPPANPITVAEGSSTGTLTINPDGSRLFEFVSNTTVVAGGGVGNTIVVAGGATYTLVDADVLIGFTSTPDLPPIETLTVTRLDGTSFTFSRVCTRAGAGQVAEP